MIIQPEPAPVVHYTDQLYLNQMRTPAMCAYANAQAAAHHQLLDWYVGRRNGRCIIISFLEETTPVHPSARAHAKAKAH